MASPRAWLGQSVNVGGISLVLRTLLGGRAALLLPHLQVADICSLDWAALRAAGFEGVIFDKDNTLTAPYASGAHPPLQPALDACLSAFGGAACVLSNSAGLAQFDPRGAEAAAATGALRLPVLAHRLKKPGGGPEAAEALLGCPASHMVLVGDRFATDVLFGNRHGMLTVRVAPLQPAADVPAVRVARAAELALVAAARRSGCAPPGHSLAPRGCADFLLQT